jgi:hypothetical protein
VRTDVGRAANQARDAATAPWEEVGRDVGEGLVDLRDAVGQVVGAVRQIAHGGTSAQVAAAKRVLGETRRSLYRILAENPVGKPGFTVAGTYFDVRVSNPSSFTSAKIIDCDLAGATTIEWWNPAANGGKGAWQLVSNQAYTAGPPACDTIRVTNTTSPTLAQLVGTVFVGANAADSLSISVSGGLSYQVSGLTTGGAIAVRPLGNGSLLAVFGSATLPGAHGGAATVRFLLVRVHGTLFVGLCQLVDPNARVNPITPVLVATVTRVATTGATGTLRWLTRRPHKPPVSYTLTFTVTSLPAV